MAIFPNHTKQQLEAGNFALVMGVRAAHCRRRHDRHELRLSAVKA
jgi:hypothetical protein